MKNGIEKRIENLETILKTTHIDMGEIYDLVKEMHRTCGFSEMDDDEYNQHFDSYYGTREEFISKHSEHAEQIIEININKKRL